MCYKFHNLFQNTKHLNLPKVKFKNGLKKQNGISSDYERILEFEHYCCTRACGETTEKVEGTRVVALNSCTA